MSEEMSNADDREFTMFNALRLAAKDMMEHGLAFARRDNPQFFAEAEKTAKEGRGRMALIVEIDPFAVSGQLFGTDEAGEQRTIEVFRFDGKPLD